MARIVAKVTLALGSLAALILVLMGLSSLGDLYGADYAPMQIAVGIGTFFSSATIACVLGLLASIDERLEDRAKIDARERERTARAAEAKEI